MYYILQVAQTSAFSELSVNETIEEVTEEVITDGLDPNTLYYWRVKSVNNLTGKYSDWSSLCWFKTRPDDVIIGQGGVGAENVIIFEIGYNKTSSSFAPYGLIGDKMCRTSGCCNAEVTDNIVGVDTLGECLSGQRRSELL